MTAHSDRKAFLVLLALACLLLARTSATAQEQPTAPAQDQQSHAATQQQPAHAPGPDQQAAPDTQRRARHLPTLDEQLKILTDRLNLDATQQGMVKIILERRQSELLDVYKNQSLSAVDRFNAMKAVHDRAYDRIGRLLNPEQSKKFELMRPHTAPSPHIDNQTIIPPRTPTS
jgi:glucose/arabinose dehydrogenase